MGNGFQFDAPLTSERATFDPLPNGDYIVTLVSADSVQRTNRNGDDQTYIGLRYQVQGGEYNGRMVYNDLLVGGANSEKAREFSYRTIREIGWAVGIPYVTNTNDLLNRPFVIEVIVTERPGYSPRNEVRRAKKLEVKPRQAQHQPVESYNNLDF